MSALKIKFTEILETIRQDRLLSRESVSDAFNALEQWVEQDVDTTPEMAVSYWKKLLPRLERLVSDERQRIENEKRKWNGFNNPYLKKLAQVADKEYKSLQIQSVSNALPVTFSYFKNLGPGCLFLAVSKSKSQFLFPKEYLIQMEELFNAETSDQAEKLQYNIREKILNLRLNTFQSIGFEIPSARLQSFAVRLGERENYTVEREDEKYQDAVRTSESLNKKMINNLVKTMRAPTIVLMTGAFLFTTVFHGDLRNLLNKAFTDHPIYLWLFLGLLIGYFVRNSISDIQSFREAQAEERQRIWSQIRNTLKNDLNNLFVSYKNNSRDLWTRATEQEKEWAAEVCENYVMTHFDAQLNPVNQLIKYLTSTDMEVSRQYNEALRQVSLPSRNHY